jgi:hypothetical protein
VTAVISKEDGCVSKNWVLQLLLSQDVAHLRPLPDSVLFYFVGVETLLSHCENQNLSKYCYAESLIWQPQNILHYNHFKVHKMEKPIKLKI